MSLIETAWFIPSRFLMLQCFKNKTVQTIGNNLRENTIHFFLNGSKFEDEEKAREKFMEIDYKQIIQITATVIGITGGLLALYKYFAERREKELREWQKVVIYRIFRQNELTTQTFTHILEKYRSEATAFEDINLKKKEISEDSLRRVLLELVSSGILSMELADSFRLKVSKPKQDPIELTEKMNTALVEIVGANPFVYTVDEVAKEMSPKVNVPIPLIKNSIRASIEVGYLVLDDKKRLSFPSE